MQSKFQLYCSCITCRTEITSQNITAHHNSKHVVKSLCLECNKSIFNKNKFCSRTCSGLFNNARKDWSKITTGPKKGSKPKSYAPYTRITQCPICNKYHTKSNTCSKPCKSILLSFKLKGKTGGNRDCSLPGVDSLGNKFYYDSHWEITLGKSLSENNIEWIRPTKFVLSDGKSYTPDFYLPKYGVYLDPKAKRPGYYRRSILKIEMFEKEFKQKCLVINNPKWLHWGHVQTMLLLNLTR